MPTNYENLIKRVNEIDDLNKAAALLSWDREVNMPKAGDGARVQQMTTLRQLLHQHATSDDYGCLLYTSPSPRD